MENIDLFNKYTALILAELYNHFPIKNALNLNNLVNGTLDDDVAWELDIEAGMKGKYSTNDPEHPRKRTSTFRREKEIAGATRDWLASCGYIMLEPASATNREDTYVLSPKGFEVLSATPKSIESTGTFGERLTGLTGDLSKEASKSAVSKIVGEVIGTALKVGLGA